MPYCGNCGSQLQPNAKFCGNCGAAQTAAPTQTAPAPTVQPTYYPSTTAAYPPPPPPPPNMNPQSFQAPPSTQPPATMPQTSGEPIVGAIPLRKLKSLGRYDAYAAVLTSQRMIFAQLTSEMVTAAAMAAKEQAKAEGKGFFGQWADQLRGSFNYTDKYLAMQPQAILAETPGNFALPNSAIVEIKIHLKGEHDNYNRRDFEAEIKSTSGTYKFHLDENSRYTDLLKQVYGDRVKMPFGYFRKSIDIKF
jgi:hypothetical protein